MLGTATQHWLSSQKHSTNRDVYTLLISSTACRLDNEVQTYILWWALNHSHYKSMSSYFCSLSMCIYLTSAVLSEEPVLLHFTKDKQYDSVLFSLNVQSDIFHHFIILFQTWQDISVKRDAQNEPLYMSYSFCEKNDKQYLWINAWNHTVGNVNIALTRLTERE